MRHDRGDSPPNGMMPAKASVMNTAESSAWPTTVEPMVRVHSQRPFVAILSWPAHRRWANSPTRYATNEASSSRGGREDPRRPPAVQKPAAAAACERDGGDHQQFAAEAEPDHPARWA